MILYKLSLPKRRFDVNNKVDIDTFTKFIKTSKWGSNGCPFILEYPYLSVPDMIKDKLISVFLNIK